MQPVWAGHPWVYAQAVDRIEGGAEPGGEVTVRDARGNALGRGLYSPGSAIPVRLYTRDVDTPIDAALFVKRIRLAVERRRNLNLPSQQTTAFRVINAEGDDLPGLIVDQFGDVIVIQIGTIGVKRRQSLIIGELVATLEPRAVVDRTTQRAAKSERFVAETGVIWGDERLAALEFLERGFRFRIPLEVVQKTGFYLDQRPLRDRIEQLAHERTVLDTFTYIGAVALSAARAPAKRVHAVDSSATALTVAAECASMNGYSERIVFERNDAYEALKYAGRHGGYDLVVCDPPKVAPTRAARQPGLAMMRRLAAAACRAARPGGGVVLSSCSAAIGISELTRAAALGARDVGLRAVVFERLFQGADHPVPAAFPEGLYLSTVLCEVTPL